MTQTSFPIHLATLVKEANNCLLVWDLKILQGDSGLYFQIVTYNHSDPDSTSRYENVGFQRKDELERAKQKGHMLTLAMLKKGYVPAPENFSHSFMPLKVFLTKLPRPQKSKTLKFPLYAQPLMSGMRAQLVPKHGVFDENGKNVKSAEDIANRYNGQVTLDGVIRQGVFYAVDVVTENMPFKDRLEILRSISPKSGLQICSTYYVQTMAEFSKLQADFIAADCDVVVRQGHALYMEPPLAFVEEHADTCTVVGFRRCPKNVILWKCKLDGVEFECTSPAKTFARKIQAENAELFLGKELSIKHSGKLPWGAPRKVRPVCFLL